MSRGDFGRSGHFHQAHDYFKSFKARILKFLNLSTLDAADVNILTFLNQNEKNEPDISEWRICTYSIMICTEL